MKRERLSSSLKNLPTIMGGQIAEDYQIVEQDEDEIHYKITKKIVPIPNGPVVYMMSFSGSDKLSRTQFILKIAKFLGRPLDIFTVPEKPDLTFACWDAEVVDQKIKN